MGGVYVKNRDQIVNVGMIRHGSCDETRAECQTYGLTDIATTFNGMVTFASAKGASLFGGLGACPLKKFSNLKALKRHFQHSRADSCVNGNILLLKIRLSHLSKMKGIILQLAFIISFLTRSE